MTVPSTKQLQDCLAQHHSTIPGLADINTQLQGLPPASNTDTLTKLIELYDACYPLLEKAMWTHETEFDSLLSDYQSLFREQEVLIQQRTQDNPASDERFNFILSIPVADRPSHLEAVLESIHQVCSRYNYGGKTNDVWNKIKIIVAEDSKEDKNTQRHLDIIHQYQQKGLQIVHLGQEEQYELLQSIPENKRAKLDNLLTTQPKERFYLKGQAANRNLSYLKFLQLTENKDRTLYYLVDSDESFCVNRQTADGDEIVYALNYFYYIDKIFRSTDTLMLTGKMVGDPPVSPSVMAANFLDDVTAFFKQLSAYTQDPPCRFHDAKGPKAGDAAYHDLANLFGFEQKINTYPYACRLKGGHDHVACLKDFASRLNAFFFGEHLTRKTWFNYEGEFTKLSPARTIYPGNYIVNYQGLKYVIPFGHLRLRMSGPTAGRLIAAELKERFASFNMPNLHQRISEEGLNDDFRPGVELANKTQNESIDISNEFERQFFGDLMLFTTEALVKKADVTKPYTKESIVQIIEQKEAELLDLYRQKHAAIINKNNQLNELVFNSGHWWLDLPESTGALQQIQTLIDNIAHNFGEHAQAWQQIQSAEHRTERKRQIIEALSQYRAERDIWDSLFD